MSDLYTQLINIAYRKPVEKLASDNVREQLDRLDIDQIEALAEELDILTAQADVLTAEELATEKALVTPQPSEFTNQIAKNIEQPSPGAQEEMNKMVDHANADAMTETELENIKKQEAGVPPLVQKPDEEYAIDRPEEEIEIEASDAEILSELIKQAAQAENALIGNIYDVMGRMVKTAGAIMGKSASDTLANYVEQEIEDAELAKQVAVQAEEIAAETGVSEFQVADDIISQLGKEVEDILDAKDAENEGFEQEQAE